MTTTTPAAKPFFCDHNGCPGDTPELIQIRVSPLFFADHISRGLVFHPHAEDATGQWLHPCDIADLLSDADYYATDDGEFGRSLIEAARRTVRALIKQGHG